MALRTDDQSVFAMCITLADPTRRAIVDALRRSESTSLTSLVDELAPARSTHRLGDEVVDDRVAVEIALHHNHLPSLEAAEVVGYDRENGTVTRGEAAGFAMRIIDWARGVEVE